MKNPAAQFNQQCKPRMRGVNHGYKLTGESLRPTFAVHVLLMDPRTEQQRGLISAGTFIIIAFVCFRHSHSFV